VSDWYALRSTVPMFSNLGLSGFSFVGADIGGFAGVPTAELYARWLQLGVFYPFMRTHTTFGTPDQEPWSYGTRYEEINRRSIEMRYELLPEIYTVMEEASRTGVPAFRPLLLEYPDDERTYQRQDEVLFGRDILVAPVLEAEAPGRGVYLPRGRWCDYWTAACQDGGHEIGVPVTPERIPVFVRAGSIVFRQPVVQHTGEMAGQRLRLLVVSDGTAEGAQYEDDGHTLAYQRGAFLRRRFTAGTEGGRWTLRVAAPEGTYRPAARDLELELRSAIQPTSIAVDGQALSRVEGDAWPAGGGWRRTPEGTLMIRTRDRFDPFTITVSP
jgi:alpha-glucosidase